MLSKIPNFKKLLSIGLILMFIGGFMLTLSSTGTGIKVLRSSKSNVRGPEPPIYPHEGQEVTSICNVSLTSSKFKLNENLPFIYLVTPTYTRGEQVAELTRLGQTLLNVPNLHWVISEDSEQCSPMVEALLRRFDLPYTHIISPMPKMYNAKVVKYKPRGVSSRRAAMNWVLKNRRESSILYFGDDDNTYDLRIFEEIRKTRKVSVFPVAYVGTQSISTPVVETRQVNVGDGEVVSVKKVVGFTDDWFANRKFPVDMAGFAVNVDFLASCKKAEMPYKAGYEEDYFIRSLNVTFDDLEPLAEGCTQILVWHTQTDKKKVPMVRLDSNQLQTNLRQLIDDLSFKGVVKVDKAGKSLAVCKEVQGCD